MSLDFILSILSGPVAAVFVGLALVFLVMLPRRTALLFVFTLVVISTALPVLPVLAQADTPAAPTAYSPNTLFHIPQAAWDQINAIAVGIILALGGLIWKWIDARSPLKNTQAEAIARDAFTNLLLVAAKYGITQADAAEKRVGDIEVGDPRVAAAANFVIAQGPGLAAKMGFDVTTPEGRAAIIRSATVRVADLMTGPDAAPAKLPLPPGVAMSGTGTPPESSPSQQNAAGKAG